jgi:4-diphosphocytidyl-2-C-methyl-D-erythritol kinase
MTDPRIFKASSPAKLNLTFAIIGDLPGDFHQVETLIQAIDLEDALRVTLQSDSATDIKILFADNEPVKDFPTDESNLIARAIRLFLANMPETKTGVQAKVEVRKAIPLAAGMGGGSSNAAATLLVMNRYFNNPFQKAKLEEMGAQLGSDVPFFIHGGVQIARNRGEKLSAVASAEKMHFVVVKPQWISIETPWIYKQYDQYVAKKKEIAQVNLKSACSAREDGNVPLAARTFVNVFENVVLQHYPILNEVRHKILELGAFGCSMTGSGPTIFAVCDSARSAASIAKELKTFVLTGFSKKEHLGLDIWPASTIDRGPTVVEISPHAVRQRR